MKVLDLFCGLKGWSRPFEDAGHEVVSVDIEERFAPTIAADVLTLDFEPGGFDIILASPPCEKFSLLGLGHHWLPGYKPKGPQTELAMELVRWTVSTIRTVQPAFWIIENPVGMLRKLNLIPFERQTVTYCQYGAPWRKPTDLWGGFPPSLVLRPRCKNGDPCHIAAARGSRTGVQSTADSFMRALEEDAAAAAREDDVTDSGKPPFLRVRAYQSRLLYGTWDQKTWAAKRAEIPQELALDVCLAAERDLAAGLRAPADFSGRLFA